MTRKRNTMYIFPEYGSMGIVCLSQAEGSDAEPFGSIEITCGPEDMHGFNSMSKFLRRTQAVTISHAPNLLQTDNPNLTHIVIACHESKTGIEKGADPLMVVIINVDVTEHIETLREFDTRVFSDGFYVLSITLDRTRSHHFLLEVFALAPKIEHANFETQMSIFVGEPLHYAEYTPPLRDPHEGLAVAVRNYRAAYDKTLAPDAVNLTGLIPDGLA